MGDWEKIVYGFNSLDETINFGARRSGELDSLYEITTLATVKNEGLSTTHVPIIHSAIVNGLLYFTINNSLRIFSSINCTSLSCSLSFKDNIDTFCTAMDGSLLLLCFRTGDINLLMMGDTPDFLYDKRLFENENLDSTFFVNAFSKIESTGIVFYLNSRNGRFYRIICPSEITPDINEDEFILELVVDLKTDVQCVLYEFPVLLFANSEKGFLYNVRDKEIISDDIGCYTKIYSYTENFCIGLNKEGEIKSICTRTSFTTQIDTDELFEDFLLIKDKNGAYFLGTTKRNELGISFIQFLSYPEYKTIFSIKISEVIHFIIPEYAYDEIMFIAEIGDDEAIIELRFQTISETIPENRLQRLLRRQKFDEAQQFAKLFNLDLIELKKAKAQMIVDKSVCTEDDIRNLINSLEDVDDCCFKIVSCLDTHACCSSLKDVERILNYTKSVPLANRNPELETLQRRASELRFRFQTFMMLACCNPLRYNVSKWYEFYDCDLIYEMDTLLAQGNIEEWKIIYSRLDVNSLEELSERDLTKTLDRISEYNVCQQLVLLNTIVPLTLKYKPGSVNYFIEWMIEKVYIIRDTDFANFPENALHFVNKVIKLLKIDSSNKLNVHQQTFIDVDCLATLRNLVNTLSKVKTLKERHGVVLPFQELLEGPETLIKALLSTLTFGFQNERFFEDFIEMFILNSSVKPDECFGIIINDVIIQQQEEYWIKVVLLMLNYINSIDKKLEITIVVLKAAKLPWCDAIRQLALNSLKYSHPLVQEIHYNIQEESRSVIFRKEPYNIDSGIENTMKFMEFAFNRIIYCNETTMVEDVYQICRNSKEKKLADRLLIQHFIDIGDFDFALKILNSCEDTLKCCENVVQCLFVAQDGQYVHYLENYYQIIGSIRRKFANSSLVTKHSISDTIDALKAIYLIRKTFNVDIKLSDFYTKSKEDLIVLIIRNIVDNDNAINDIVALINKCETVASFLQLENHLVLVELCENVDDFNVILNAAKVVYETTDDSKVLCKMATLIITHAGAPDINVKVSELQSFQDFGNIDLEPFLNGFELARKMVSKAVINSSRSNLVQCLELGDWMEVAYSLVQSKPNVLFSENTRTDESMLPSISVFNAIKDCFYFYRNFMNFPAYEVKVSHADGSLRIAEGQVLTEIRYLHSTITNLTSEGNALIAYKLIKTLHGSLTFQLNSKNDIHQHLVAILKNSAMHLVKYIFSSSLIDFNLTVHLLIICDDVPNCKRVLFQNLKRYKRNLHKVEKIAQAYLDYVKYYNVDDGQILCTNLLCLVKWWKRLKNCHIPYDEFFATQPKDNLVKLIKCNDLNIDMIYEFCSSVGENEQFYYKLYLQNLFLNWKPKFTVFVDNYGNECIRIDHDHEAYVDLCYEVTEVIDDHVHSVICLLDSIWDKINVYHYEIFKCGLDLLSVLNKSKCQKPKKILLSFLNNYHRTSTPGEAEKEQWFTLYPDTQCIDPLSKWRLPFTPTLMSKDIWSIIRPEISLKTYKKWFEALPVLKYLNKDDICSYVIKDVMASDRFTATDHWLTRAKHKDLLYEIDMCIENMSNLEQATSAMYSLLSKIPGGGDLVMAAALCYKYALKYQEDNPNSKDVEKAFLKVQKKYIHYSIIHILHLNQLADKKYLNMVSGPIGDLIESLYMDNRILQSAEKIGFDCPDINKTVEQLAVLYQIDIGKKRKELLQNWLSIGSQENVLSLSASFKSVYDCGAGYEYLIRASYLCTSGNIDDWQYYLLSIGNVDLNESKSSGMKVMALKCFCNITDPKIVESLTGMEINDFRNSINKLSLINELPNFGFCLTMDSLDNKSKSELLSQLSYHLNNKVAVKTMALICITYKLYDARYWKIITTAMIKLKMFPELKESIIFLKKNVALYNCQWYIDSWQLVINNEFKSVANISKTTIRNQYIQNFFFIQDCPVSVNLDLVPKLCLETKQYDLLILSLQYFTIEQQEHYLDELHKLNVSTDDKIEQLTTLGFWGVQYVKDIVLKYKNKNCCLVDI